MTSRQAALYAEFFSPRKLLSYEFFLSDSMSDVPARRRYSPSRPAPPRSASLPPSLLSLAAFPFHLLNPLRSSPRRKFDAGGFQSTDLFFHIGIYFFTARCTEWMKKESRWGIGLPSSFSLSPSFFPSPFFFHVPRAHSVWLRISIERRWWMAIGIKLCGAPALMLRNTHIWKLGKFDLRSVAPSSAYTFHVWSNAAPQIAAAAVAREIYMKIVAVPRTDSDWLLYIDQDTRNISFLRRNVKLMPRTTRCEIIDTNGSLVDLSYDNFRDAYRTIRVYFDYYSYYVLSISLERERQSLSSEE